MAQWNQVIVVLVGQAVIVLFGVLVGVLYNNKRLDDFQHQMDKRFDDLKDWIRSEFKRVDERIDHLAARIDRLEERVGKIEERLEHPLVRS